MRLDSSSVEQRDQSGVLQGFMAQVYGWMASGLILTAFVAWYVAHSPAVMHAIFSNQILFFGLIIVQFGVVWFLSASIGRLSPGVATTLFMGYAALTGLTVSSIFIVFTYSSIASTFVAAAGMFAVMSIYGYTTKRDLSGFGTMFFMALIGIVIASLINLWLKSGTLSLIISYIGVVLFVGMTAYDTQRIKSLGTQVAGIEHGELRKVSIIGALTLYLDFINLFMMLLNIMGNRNNQ